MKGLETGKDKIQKISDALRKETLEPAKQEVREMIENAHIQASEIVKEAKKKAAEIIAQGEKELEEKKKVFQASLALACKQGIEELRQKIEKDLFSPELSALVGKEMQDPKLIAHLLNTFMKSMEEKGVEEDFSALIPKTISARTVNDLLAERVLERLEDQTVVCSDIGGGVQIQLKESKITVDVSDRVVKELIAQYIRKDFRELVFNV